MPKAMVATTTTASPERKRAAAARFWSARQAGMEGDGGDALAVQPRGDAFGLGAAAAIDDAGLAAYGGAAARSNCAVSLTFASAAMCRFGRWKLAVKTAASLHAQRGQDVDAGARIGGRGQRDARHAGETLRQAGEFAVFRAELVAPLADAMRLVDREQRDVPALQPLHACRG